MGKKARIRAKRLAEAKGAKSILEQINALNHEIAESEAELKRLEAGKAKVLEGLLIGENQGGRLSDFLNDAQIQAVVDILNRPNLDDIAQAKLLKQYLGQFHQELLAKGYRSDYLAYLIIANANAIRQSATQSSEPEPPFDPSRN